jgi:hypothetical protein
MKLKSKVQRRSAVTINAAAVTKVILKYHRQLLLRIKIVKSLNSVQCLPQVKKQ